MASSAIPHAKPAADGEASDFLQEQRGRAARRKDATEAAAAFRDHESAMGHVFKVSGPRE
jgi:hypothetical protein